VNALRQQVVDQGSYLPRPFRVVFSDKIGKSNDLRGTSGKVKMVRSKHSRESKSVGVDREVMLTKKRKMLRARTRPIPRPGR